jgi:type I restriction enzyme S subunit
VADVCSSIDYGYTAAATDGSQGPRFLRITDIVQPQLVWETVPHVEADRVTLAKYRLVAGDIVLARTGASTGSSAYIQDPPEAVFASYLVRLKIKPTFDARFVSYYLKSDLFWSYIRGVLGDIGEQRRISGILGALDDKIQLNRRISQTIESMARALFKSWFVDFDPVRAKAEGGDRGLPQPLADLFPDSFQDSELGAVPSGWPSELWATCATALPWDPSDRTSQLTTSLARGCRSSGG